MTAITLYGSCKIASTSNPVLLKLTSQHWILINEDNNFSIQTNLLFSRNYVKRLIQNNCIGIEEVQTVTNLTAKPCLKCIINLTENDKYFAVF